MTSNTDRVRLSVFRIWFLTLAIILVVYASKFVGFMSTPFNVAFQSLQMMIGLVVPQIGVMAAFYLNLDRQRDKIESLTKAQITVVAWLSVAYHVIFNAALIGGIVFYVFDRSADSESLQRNTAAIMAIMGLFSVFLLPVAFLFSRPNSDSPPVVSSGESSST